MNKMRVLGIKNFEQKSLLVDQITNEYLNKLEEEFKFTFDDRESIIKNHIDTLSQFELNLPEKDFKILITEWLEDMRNIFLENFDE